MKLHNGWLITNDGDGYCRRSRFRLSAVTHYAYAEVDDITIVWLGGKCAEEFKGDHVELLDSYFAKETA